MKAATKAVILCAGKSTRTYPLTITRPKPLLPLANKPLLRHTLEQLVEAGITSVVLVVGYRQEMIRAYIDRLKKEKEQGDGQKIPEIVYAHQKEQRGGGDALLAAAPYIQNEPFLLLHGDDLYFAADIRKLQQHDAALLAHETAHPEQFGILRTRKKNGKEVLESIVEKPKEYVGNLANIGCYKLHSDIFQYGSSMQKSERGEFEIVDLLLKFSEEHEVVCVRAEQWNPVTYAWSLLDANRCLLDRAKQKNEGTDDGTNWGTIEPNVTIKGSVSIGKGTLIRANSYLEGPVMIGENCTIGPNCYLRPGTTIGNNCRIGFEVEIKNSIVMDNTAIPHLSYIGDSVIGENVNIGAGTITANVRHDKGLIRASVKDELVDTGREKLGTIIGDGAKLGIRTIIYPGRKIWPGMTTMPGEAVEKDVR